MKYAAPLLALTLLLSACEPELTVAPTEKSPVIKGEPAVAASQPDVLDFGDVEQTLFLEIEVPESDIAESWNAEELRTANNKRLTLMTLDIVGPAPTELPVTFLMKSKTNFAENPVALRGKVFRQLPDAEPEAVYSFKTLIDRPITYRHGAVPEPGRFPFKFSLNAREGLTEVPSSVLLYIEAEAVMLDPGTNLDEVDPATVTGDVDQTGVLLSNALRINFDPSAVLVDSAPTESAPATGDPEAAPDSADTAAEVAPADAAAPAPSETPAPATEAPAAP